MIRTNSPLRRVSNIVTAKEANYFDGIRFALEMIDISSVRLHSFLERAANDEAFKITQPMALAFLDAWSIVDSIHRLRLLVDRFRGSSTGTYRHVLSSSNQPQTWNNFATRFSIWITG